MKDGRTHLAHKAEHAVDLETGAVVAVTVQPASDGDTTSSQETLIEAAEQIEAVVPDGRPKELVADKGYHSNQALVDYEAIGLRSYISEPDRGRRNWQGPARPRPGTRSIGTAVGFAGPAANGCCVSAANAWNGPMRISTPPGRCAACTCAGTRTF